MMNRGQFFLHTTALRAFPPADRHADGSARLGVSTRSEKPVTGCDYAQRIALFDANPAYSQEMTDFLQQHNIDTYHQGRGENAVRWIAEHCPDLVLLDITLPGKNGIEICRELRALDIATPVLLLSALPGDVDEVLGLEMGADGYLRKPVPHRVLLARIRAALRGRAQPQATRSAGDVLAFGGLRICHSTREVLLYEQPVRLTFGEFELLWLLALHAGEVLDRESIVRVLRGQGGRSSGKSDGKNGTLKDRSVDAIVSRLRIKLGDDQALTPRIVTVRANGYMLRPKSKVVADRRPSPSSAATEMAMQQ